MNEEHDAETTLVTAAIVLRMPLDSVTELKRLIKDIDDTKIVYQRYSVGKLKIVDDNGD